MIDEVSRGRSSTPVVARLEKTGLVETFTRPDGRVAYRFTEEGGRVGRMLALAGDDEGAVLDALLGVDVEG